MAIRHPATGHMLSCLCQRCGEANHAQETQPSEPKDWYLSFVKQLRDKVEPAQPDDLREDTERIARELLFWHGKPGCEPEIVQAAAHLRRLQQRSELLAAERDLHAGISKAALERVGAIEGALEWAAKDYRFAFVRSPNAVAVKEGNQFDSWVTQIVSHNGTGSSIADALIELAKRGGGA